MKMSTAIIFVLLFASGVFLAHGIHFRGGTINWKPTRVGNQVEVTYKLSFNGFKEQGEVPPVGHDFCTQEKKDSGQALLTTGWLKCKGCDPETYRDLEWRCSDLDEVANWDIGAYSFNQTVPDVNKKVILYFEQCCWVGPLRNAPTQHPNQGWKMLTEINLQPRVDNGLLNSSPISSAIPIQKFHADCIYYLEIPVTDPDNDPYRCRYTASAKEECFEYSDDKYGDVCSELPYVTVYANCTLKFDTSGGEGYYAVRVMIEDLDRNGDPMSRVSLSFLLQVDPDNSTCKIPIIKQPLRACKTVPVGHKYQETVVVEAASIDLPIDRVETNKPAAMTVSTLKNVSTNPLQKRVILNWVPTRKHIGKQSVGINAVDKSGFVSGWKFLVLKVVDGKILNAVPVESTPSRGAVMSTAAKWKIKFNMEIQRPSTPAYIELKDKTGKIVGVVDASDERQVRFSRDKLSFSMSPPNLDHGTQKYRLVMEPGVAIHAENDNCDLYSQPAEWNVLVKQGPEVRGTPSGFPRPSFKCTAESMYTAAPTHASEGDVCFVHLETAYLSVTNDGIDVSYNLCCQSECRADVVLKLLTDLTPETKWPAVRGSRRAAGAFSESSEEETAEGPKGPVGTPSSGVTFTCTSESMSIAAPVSANEGDVCFMHLEVPDATVMQENIGVPYKLCCPSECRAVVQPAVQPALTPKTKSRAMGGSRAADGTFSGSSENNEEAEVPSGPQVAPIRTEDQKKMAMVGGVLWGVLGEA